jgi:hypothetical protein
VIVGTVALIMLLMNGAASESWPALAKKEISHVIEDEGRRKEAEAILDRMLESMNSHLKSVLECRKELVAVELRYESTAADFRAAYAKLDQIWRASEDNLVNLRFELRERITRVEWDALCDRVEDKQDDDDDERDDD